MKNLTFKAAYLLKRPKVLQYYREFVQNCYKTQEELEYQQTLALRNLIEYCCDQIPYYQQLFKRLKLSKHDIRSINDLEKLPILTKAELKNCLDQFYPIRGKIKYINGLTGGSTGAPLKYRMSPECYERGVALLFRGWGLGGYALGDRLGIIAGRSLVSPHINIIKNVQNYLSNIRRYSSYRMDSIILQAFILKINNWQPSYLRGYASSLYLLAKYIQDSNIDLRCKLKGIYSTAEVLCIHQRSLIEKTFQTKVYDNYGLNDGGVSAYECKMHNGMHIDSERAILQTVNEDGNVVIGKTGRIIATSLYNYAMPFIRYDTGDLGHIETNTSCGCGIRGNILKQVYGRTNDYLKINNIILGSPSLMPLMKNINFDNYQIVQISSNDILIKYVMNDCLTLEEKSTIFKSFSQVVGALNIHYEQVNPNQLNSENKHKFIINDVCR